MLVRVLLQNISAARKCHPEDPTKFLPLYPVPVYEREKQVEKLHKLTEWMQKLLSDQTSSDYCTIHGLGSWGRPSLFAMSTQGVLDLALTPGVLIASACSLETHESTSRGLDTDPLLQFSTARIWATSDFSPPVHNVKQSCKCSASIKNHRA